MELSLNREGLDSTDRHDVSFGNLKKWNHNVRS